MRSGGGLGGTGKHAGQVRRLGFSAWFAQDIAATPNGIDQVRHAGDRKLLAQPADDDVDGLHLRLFHAGIKMIEERILVQNDALFQEQQFQTLNSRRDTDNFCPLTRTSWRSRLSSTGPSRSTEFA